MIVFDKIQKVNKIQNSNNLFNMTLETFPCSKCKKELPRTSFHEFATDTRKRPVTSKCRDCRKEEYFSSKYETKCICCLKNRKVDDNQQCKECNEAAGIRECKQCKQLLPLFLMFYGKNRKCKKCLKGVDE